MGEAAYRLSQFDYLLEGDVLMLLRRQGLCPGLLQQFTHAGRTRQVHAQCQGVNEEADQVLDLDPSAVGHRRTDHHIRLTGQPRQQRRPTSQQSHVQGGAMLLTESFQLRSQFLVQHQPGKGSGEVLLCRAGMVGG